MAVVDRWSLFSGCHWLKFGCSHQINARLFEPLILSKKAIKYRYVQENKLNLPFQLGFKCGDPKGQLRKSYKKASHKLLVKLQGSISPNFVRQAKRRRRTAFGEKNAIQFHQHTVALNWPQTVHKICAPFAKYVRCSPVAVLHKRLRILKAKKSRAKVGRNVDEIDPRWQSYKIY